MLSGGSAQGYPNGGNWPYGAPSPPAVTVGMGSVLAVEVCSGFVGVAQPAAIAGTSVQGSRVLTVTAGSTADVVEGMYIYSADGSGDMAGFVMAVNGSELTLDTPAPIGKYGDYVPQGVIPPGTLALTSSPSSGVHIADWNYATGRTPGDGTLACNAAGQAQGLFLVSFYAAGTFDLTAAYTPSDANLYDPVTSSPLSVTVA